MSRKPIPLTVNCGYSRVAIWEYSHLSGTSVYSCNKEERAEKFQELFADGLELSMPSSYWAINTCTVNNFSKFDRHKL